VAENNLPVITVHQRRCFRSLYLLLAASVSAAACSSSGDGDNSTGRARQGAPIVENAGPAPSAVWSFAPEPSVDIGSEGASELFLATAAVRSAGGIVVANAGTGELRWFDSSGRFLRAAGHKGSGPGEFQHITWVGVLPGDSVAAWDPLLRRLSIFAPDGRLARTLPVNAGRGPLPSVLGRLADGSLLLSARTSSDPPQNAAVWRDSIVLMRIMPGNERVDTIGRFPGMEWYAGAQGTGGPRIQAVPFGKLTVAAASDSTVYIGTGDRYEIGVYGTDGTLRARIRKPHRPERLTARDRQTLLASIVQVGGSEGERRERAQMLASAPFPETMPAYVSSLADAAGNLWVREPQRPSATPGSSHWSVFDRQGRWIATVRGPERFKAFQIGPDWILGFEADSADAEHVRLYRIRKQ
jgi:hypothetical protein